MLQSSRILQLRSFLSFEIIFLELTDFREINNQEALNHPH